ncbi:MAG: hypothetical protein HPY79_01350 [Bacteroidales bacterium]|nr:hypothetical protein [Bacteroidales bacterium]
MKKAKSLIILLVALTTIIVIDSCKRGVDDPFFSFKSRKARVTGDWTVESMESQILKTIGTQQLKANVKFNINGTSVSLSIDSIDTPHDTTKSYTGIIKESEYRFDKNSKMTHTLKYEITEEKTQVNETTNQTTIERWVTTFETKGSGSWNFLGRVEINGIDKYKNKERISFIYEYKYQKIDSVYTKRVFNEEMIEIPNLSTYKTSSYVIDNGYANGQYAEIWVLRELRDKKIVMERDVNEYVVTNTVSTVNGSTGTSTSSSYRGRGAEKITLKPRQ